MHFGINIISRKWSNDYSPCSLVKFFKFTPKPLELLYLLTQLFKFLLCRARFNTLNAYASAMSGNLRSNLINNITHRKKLPKQHRAQVLPDAADIHGDLGVFRNSIHLR